MPKQKWVPAQTVDPNIFVRPSREKKFLSIRKPQESVVKGFNSVHKDTDKSQYEINVNHELSTKTRANHIDGHSNRLSREHASADFPSLKSEGVDTTKSLLTNTIAENVNPLLRQPPTTSTNGITQSTAENVTDLNGTDQSVIHDTAERSPASQPLAGRNNVNDSLRSRAFESDRSKLDIYAQKYVPYWLKAINESYATFVRAPQITRIDLDAYQNAFAGTQFQAHPPPLQLPPSVPIQLQKRSLAPDQYSNYWQDRLCNEYAAQLAQNTMFTLFDVQLIQVDQAQMLYRFRLPGLREGIPRVDLGDFLLIRPFIKPQRTVTQDIWNYRDNAGALAPGFIGVEHHAVVWSIVRRDELVIVRLGNLVPIGARCNVIIPLQINKTAPAWRAVQITGPIAQTTTLTPSSWLSSMLFPSKGTIQNTLFKGTFDLDWYDKDLNYEQKKAVQAVVDSKYGTIPYIISGPPGTGKTKTIVETALQLLNTSGDVRPHLLLCAPSDAAADTLLVRLSAHLFPKQLFRLNNWTRLSSEVPGEVGPYCFLDNNQLYSLPAFKTFMDFQIVVTSCRDANVLVTAGLTNMALASIAVQTMTAIAPTALDRAKLMYWTALLIDEAAQATEPEVLIPISVVSPSIDKELAHLPHRAPQLIMAGDEFQLGPNLVSTALRDSKYDTSGLEQSLFQRLFSRRLYADHPLSRSRGLQPLTRDMLPIVRPPFTNLIRNYRSHPAILSTSSTLFYSDTLIPERPETSEAILSWSRWPKQNDPWPVMFYQHKGVDNVEDIINVESGSLINHDEVRIVLDLVIDLIKHVNSNGTDILRGEDIIVMSPFRAQVNLLRQAFRAEGYYDVRIGPLEAFQGLESGVVVLCTTRTRLAEHPQPAIKFVHEDRARNAGIIDQPKLFNVAMTRAKEGLIVVGDSSVLTVTRDKCWLSFLRFCDRNSLVAGGKVTWFGKDDTNSRVRVEGPGKLERALKYAESLAAEENRFNDEASAERTDGGLEDGVRENFRFKLKGTMIDMDQQMWQSPTMHVPGDELFYSEEDEIDETSLQQAQHETNGLLGEEVDHDLSSQNNDRLHSPNVT